MTGRAQVKSDPVREAMEPRYHTDITIEVLGPSFDKQAMWQVILANVAQDSLASLFGTRPQHHVDDDKIQEAAAYVEEQHDLIAALATDPSRVREQRQALGRLLHGVQDFYSHTNYVDLWLRKQSRDSAAEAQFCATGCGKQSRSSRPVELPAEEIDPLDEELLHSPDLRSGHYVPVLGLLYLLPVVGRILARLYTVPGSHEAMNLDSPARGPRFLLARKAARKRTQYETHRAAAAILEAGGEDALRRFYGA